MFKENHIHHSRDAVCEKYADMDCETTVTGKTGSQAGVEVILDLVLTNSLLLIKQICIGLHIPPVVY